MTGADITRENYIEKIKKEGDYATYVEISALANTFNTRIAVYLKDERYSKN